MSVKITGKLFTGKVTKAVRRSIRATERDAINILRRNTPVDTGLLRSKWGAIPKTGRGYAQLTLYNNTYYAGYVEEGTRHMRGRFMARRSLPQIQKVFSENLKKEVNNELGTRLTAAVSEFRQDIRGILR